MYPTIYSRIEAELQTRFELFHLIMATFKLFKENQNSIHYSSNKERRYFDHVLHESGKCSSLLCLTKPPESLNLIEPTSETWNVSS